MVKKPQDLIYGVDDKPPFWSLFFLGIQHIFLMSSTLVLPVVLVTQIGGSFEQVRSVVALTMIACGIGTILQAVRCGIIGSGFVCPNLCGPNFFMVSMESAWLGGLPLMRGMTIVAGLVEGVFSRFVSKIKFLFPPEITGLVVLMVAEGLVPLGASKFFGINYEGEPISWICGLVAAITLFVMIGVNIWGKGKLRLYSVLIGLFCGYVLSFFTGMLPWVRFHDVLNSQWLALPFLANMFEVSFKWSLLPVFIIVSITGALKSFGNLIMCEKVNDDEWTEPDMKRIANGLTADAVCVTVSGLLGGVASDTSASNVALSRASGATSRYIGYMAGALFIVFGFLPKISALLSIMPTPVMGAILIFVTSFMILSGIQIILGSGVDTRKTFIIGISFIFGLSIDILPSLFVGLPFFLQPLFDSSLTMSTILAVILNQVLQIGKNNG
ncbi:MAG: purine/pyrimidine permease [Candidatus Saganbacteria bacterium]|nr:purine/pyrimidine permease [Candidatus Saganbacteria bacterium]